MSLRDLVKPLLVLIALTALAASAVVAQADEATARALRPADLHEQFVRCGYRLQGHPNGAYFAVRDPIDVRDDARVLMVVVYLDVEDAVAAHTRAHAAAEDRLGWSVAMSDDHGPQLLVGYGGSVWRRNVAIVQSSLRDLSSLWYVDVQTDEQKLLRPEAFDLSFAPRVGTYAVDADFVMCLEDLELFPTVAGPTGASGDPQAVFLRGHPY
jgi:hypothetical protein